MGCIKEGIEAARVDAPAAEVAGTAEAAEIAAAAAAVDEATGESIVGTVLIVDESELAVDTNSPRPDGGGVLLPKPNMPLDIRLLPLPLPPLLVMFCPMVVVIAFPPVSFQYIF